MADPKWRNFSLRTANGTPPSMDRKKTASANYDPALGPRCYNCHEFCHIGKCPRKIAVIRDVVARECGVFRDVEEGL